MKNKPLVLLASSISLLLLSCNNVKQSDESSLESIENSDLSIESVESVNSVESSSSSVEQLPSRAKNDELFNEYYDDIIDLKDIDDSMADSLMFDEDVFGELANPKYQQLYLNNELITESFKEGQLPNKGANSDLKYLFYNDDTMKFVNRSDGYTFNIKTDTTYVPDFSVAACRNRLYNEETTISVSKEVGKNPYKLFSTYRDDWLIRHFANEKYISDNNMKYTESVVFGDTSILKGSEVYIYSIEIKDAGNIRKMFYNIGIIKDKNDLKGDEFYLIVMKSNHNRNDDFRNLIKSFEKIQSFGTTSNHLDNMELKYNPNWDETTKKYFDKFSTQQRTDWGMFTACIEQDNIVKNKVGALSTAMDYEFDILPTYLHLTSNGKQQSFATSNAKSLAGGDGFNGKMVLQLSYQYTNNNNELRGTDQYTPMFDILRGPREGNQYFFDIRNKIDDGFNALAEAIKAYKAPVLFRVNNEMNTDWTSYCGMITLVDPDIFIATWRKLYQVFEEHGVTNAIWIFNPVAETCPYSSWSEDMSYFPGIDYVQALGLTYYSDNNGNNVNEKTFQKNYTKYYNKNNAIWKNYPWIISEFGCGSGGNASGERYRNQISQAAYVEGMFNDFNDRENNPYLQNIKGAVWFSVNDSANGKITNQYELVVEKLPLTIEAFKKGLASNKQ